MSVPFPRSLNLEREVRGWMRGFVDVARLSPQQRNAQLGPVTSAGPVRLTASSGRPALDTPSSFTCSLPLPGSLPPALQQPGSTSPPKTARPAPVILQRVVDRQFDEIHQRRATHPRAHQFRNTSNLFHGFRASSSDHHQCFCRIVSVSRPSSATESKKLDPGPPLDRSR